MVPDVLTIGNKRLPDSVHRITTFCFAHEMADLRVMAVGAGTRGEMMKVNGPEGCKERIMDH
jgi:hypothetical protein